MAILAAAMLMVAAALEPTPEISQAAEQAGVDVVDLEGALLTVGEPDPIRYLRHAGHLPWPVVPAAPARSVWDSLASCESGERWNIATGNGFYGGLQFDRQTWLAYGGGAYAATAAGATRAQQIAVAEKLRAARGFQPWPACSRRLGLR
jgi:hypothetical protein